MIFCKNTGKSFETYISVKGFRACPLCNNTVIHTDFGSHHFELNIYKHKEKPHVVFINYQNFVAFKTSGGRFGSGPILKGESRQMTHGRILQSLGFLDADQFTYEVISE